jgi:nitrate reductase alpha subunit
MSKEKDHTLKKTRFFRKKEKNSEGWSEIDSRGRKWEDFYRKRWQYDKVVRTTHGVNCTGSCSWNVFVKNGIITWEHQATDYPTTGPDMPEYEPRGCPRGASFSWYTYSPLRVKFPYVRGILLNFWREALKKTKDPVKAWQLIAEDSEKSKAYKEARGKGGLIRTSWEEANEIITAQLIYTIEKYGPDRITGFTPIPAMSMVSYASGSRFLSLIGGSMLSFYDWYADLPPASPQIWGEQTDVPESGDWYNAGYIIIWGTNIPLTRTPDAHFMTEVRYKGTKVISINPDYAESVKFADEWLAVNPGADGALAQAMTHVILKEFYVNQQTAYFYHYAKKYTDLPFLVLLKKQNENFVVDRFLRASDIDASVENGEWKMVVVDEKSNQMVIPRGSIGHRWEGKKTWNLELMDETGKEFDPKLSILGSEDQMITINLPYFDDEKRSVLQREIPVKEIKINGESFLVSMVYDIMLANYGIARTPEQKNYPKDYDDLQAYTPAWQEQFTGIKRNQVIKIAREFAQNAIETKGRSMILMGGGTNHWFHADINYRTMLNLVILTGSEGVRGGGWAHYVGQEKVRPFEGWSTIAFAKDWTPAARLQNGTSYFYFGTDQFRYEEIPMSELSAPTIDKPRYEHPADYNVLSARLGWSASYPQFNRNTLKLAEEAQKAGAKNKEEIINNVVQGLKDKKLEFSLEDPDNPVNFPRTLFVWRANLISSSGKGHEYFLKHLLGTHQGVLAEDASLLGVLKEVKYRKEAPQGKLDLLVNLEFRMSGTALYSDIVLPAATWYEKTDISSTDMHPYVHPFNPAISPPWEAKTDWDIFKNLAKVFSKKAKIYLSGIKQDLITTPLMHDTPGETTQPFGKIKDWSKGETEPVPGKTMPQLSLVERDYTHVDEMFVSLGPLAEKNPMGADGVSWSAKEEYEQLKKLVGVHNKGLNKDMPSLEDADKVANAMLTLSSSTHGKVAAKAWEAEAHKTGLPIADFVADRKAEHFTLKSITAQPKESISTPVFTGNNKEGRYSPFLNNIGLQVPFRTLTGRQQFFVDHETFLEYGEGFPVYKPTLHTQAFYPKIDRVPAETGKTIGLKYLTPHGKWNIHSMFYDDERMLTLFRGGQTVWINDKDAEKIDVRDNDWIEMFNRNGVVVARAVVSHRMPQGTTFMYHAQDRTIYVPNSEITGMTGGTHNSPTKIHIKPTHFVGGYAQLSYGFNYYGPTGNQRDLKIFIRKLKKVIWHED